MASYQRGRSSWGWRSSKGENVVEGVLRAHGLGINPGGEVVAFTIPEALEPPAEWRDRLLSRAEAERLAAWMDEIPKP